MYSLNPFSCKGPGLLLAGKVQLWCHCFQKLVRSIWALTQCGSLVIPLSSLNQSLVVKKNLNSMVEVFMIVNTLNNTNKLHYFAYLNIKPPHTHQPIVLPAEIVSLIYPVAEEKAVSTMCTYYQLKIVSILGNTCMFIHPIGTEPC